MLELETIDAGNWTEAIEVRVADDQEAFVTTSQPVALVILAKCHIRPDGRRWEPLLMREPGGVVVGVLAIAHADEGCELRHVAVDERWQGRGFGTAAVRAVVDRARAPGSECDQFLVTAHPHNVAAHATYAAAGFSWDGEERSGEPVWRCDVTRRTDVS